MGPIFFSHGDIHTKTFLSLLHSGLEDLTEAETGPKQSIVSLKTTHSDDSDDRVLCVYVLSGHNAKKQLARGHLFKGLQNYMENKSKKNENKMTLWDVNCTTNKMDIKHKHFID